MSESQQSLTEYFTFDHRSCDGRWTDVEAAVEAGMAEDIVAAWQRFDGFLRRHLQMEEEVLFPAFEEATGMSGGGPTFVMRSEHEQMRGLLDQMGASAAAGAFEELVDLGDTLLMLIQQHNAKEEQMLYPMAERALTPHWAGLRERFDAYPGVD
ncbi:MAG: hemerythrin domain-containing protein [Deltaproteobacteria bacterium]|nr:hemerythrin domain-containing protein [Deltaproteobacteria bacterium]MBW2417487.1 hemerythrin domain-containing protein [Deltaproteobacteria bacterium]